MEALQKINLMIPFIGEPMEALKKIINKLLNLIVVLIGLQYVH